MTTALRRRRRRRRRPAHAAGAAARAARASSRRTSSSSTARTPPAASGSRRSTADELFAVGVDVDHARQPHLPPPRGLALPRRAARASCARPTSCARQPGHGTLRGRARRRRAWAWSTSQGNLYLQAGRAAFAEVDAALQRARASASTTCSSTCTPRRRARRSRWAGTSTAASPRWSAPTRTCPTADARVLPGGTAYITDVGMTGPRGGVIGVKREQAIESLRHPDAGRASRPRTRTRG